MKLLASLGAVRYLHVMPHPNRPEAIKARRISLGLKRSQLAEKTGLSYQHIWGIEEGRHPASVEALARIAFTLDLDAMEVISGREEATTGTKGTDPWTRAHPSNSTVAANKASVGEAS